MYYLGEHKDSLYYVTIGKYDKAFKIVQSDRIYNDGTSARRDEELFGKDWRDWEFCCDDRLKDEIGTLDPLLLSRIMIEEIMFLLKFVTPDKASISALTTTDPNLKSIVWGWPSFEYEDSYSKLYKDEEGKVYVQLCDTHHDSSNTILSSLEKEEENEDKEIKTEECS